MKTSKLAILLEGLRLSPCRNVYVRSTPYLHAKGYSRAQTSSIEIGRGAQKRPILECSCSARSNIRKGSQSYHDNFDVPAEDVFVLPPTDS